MPRATHEITHEITLDHWCTPQTRSSFSDGPSTGSAACSCLYTLFARCPERCSERRGLDGCSSCLAATGASRSSVGAISKRATAGPWMQTEVTAGPASPNRCSSTTLCAAGPWVR